jgi:hypothetical protein
MIHELSAHWTGVHYIRGLALEILQPKFLGHARGYEALAFRGDIRSEACNHFDFWGRIGVQGGAVGGGRD